MRYLLEISYKGTNYHGWQIQINAHSVQEELNNALKILLSQEISTIGSGRTDTGVHATQQFVHFDSNEITDFTQFLFRLNAILPKDIFAKKIISVADNFSARHDAVLRSYEYRISQTKNPFLENQCCYFYKRDLDIEKMNRAAKYLYQYSDFQSFSKYKTAVKDFECLISHAKWQYESELLVFHISANRFLRGMVRAIVGTMLDVGMGKIKVEEFEKIILKKDRCAAKFAAPPEGLFLTQVKYKFNIE